MATQPECRSFFAVPARTIALLVLLALIPRVWMASQQIAPARDTFRFWDAARAYEQLPFVSAVRAMQVHPLYPITFSWAKYGWTTLTGQDGPRAWVRAALVWNLFSYLVFLSLAFLAGAQIWNPRLAFWGCLAIALVPRQVSYSVDVLSDNLHAALWMSSFFCLVLAWKSHKTWLFILAGLFAGLAYWTRIEAILLPCTFLAALGITLWYSPWRWSWRRSVAAFLAFFLPWGFLFGGYCWLRGNITPRDSGFAVLGTRTLGQQPLPITPGTLPHPIQKIAGDDITRYQPQNPPPATADKNRDFTELTDKVDLTPRVFVDMEGYDPAPLFVAIKVVFQEIGQETRGWLLVLALVASCVWHRPRATWPTALLALFAFLGCMAMVLLLKMRAGYLAGRYMTPVLPLLSIYAMTGAEFLLSFCHSEWRFPWETSWNSAKLHFRRATCMVGGLLILALALCVPGWLKPMHRHRFGHMLAAEWLVEYSSPQEAIFDPAKFSSFFAERPTWEPVEPLPRHWPVRFAVIDPSMVYRTEHHIHRAIARVNRQGRLVAKFPRTPGGSDTGIYIFYLPETIVSTRGNQRGEPLQ